MPKIFILIILIMTFGSLNIVSGQSANENDYFLKQRGKAIEERDEPTGADIEGLIVPDELSKDDTSKQDAKLKEIEKMGFKKPMDFGDLALKKLNNELISLQYVTENYLSEMGFSANTDVFFEYDVSGQKKTLLKSSPKYIALSKLADNFDGLRFNIDVPGDRRKVKIALLRLVNPKVKTVLEEIADAYKSEFGRPLRVTGAGRSVEYQKILNLTVPSTNLSPSHLSGCAIDLSFLFMTAKEQNFLMSKLAEMEKKGILDALREDERTVFHIFVYPY